MKKYNIAILFCLVGCAGPAFQSKDDKIESFIDSGSSSEEADVHNQNDAITNVDAGVMNEADTMNETEVIITATTTTIDTGVDVGIDSNSIDSGSFFDSGERDSQPNCIVNNKFALEQCNASVIETQTNWTWVKTYLCKEPTLDFPGSNCYTPEGGYKGSNKPYAASNVFCCH